jgi:phospholipid transport system substrate-binding protein
MKKILTFFLFSIIFISNTNISLSIEPEAFIQSTVNRAASTLSGNLSKEERIKN